MHMSRALSRLLLAAMLVLLTSCAAHRDREDIRQGLLTLDISESAFLDVWGRPSQTASMSGDEIIKSGVSGWGSFFFKRREMYEKWVYDKKNVDLIFLDQKLVAWKTSETVQELAGQQPAPDSRSTPIPRY